MHLHNVELGDLKHVALVDGNFRYKMSRTSGFKCTRAFDYEQNLLADDNQHVDPKECRFTQS